MKIVPHKKAYYSEIQQDKQILFAPCNKIDDKLIMLSYWINCRDYFSDILYAEENGKSVGLYGFKYDGETSHIDRDKTRFLIMVKEEADQENIENNIPILRTIEVGNGLELTSITKIRKGYYLVEGDAFWLNTSFSLHLYTYLIKVLGYKFGVLENWFKELQKYQTIEGRYARSLQEDFLKALHRLKDIFGNPTTVHGYIEDKSNGESSWEYFLHNTSGIVSLFSRQAEHLDIMKSNEYYKRLKEVLK